MPKIVEEPKLAYHYASRPDSYYVTVPCKAVGNPTPIIKWFSGVEEVRFHTVEFNEYFHFFFFIDKFGCF